jgi:hypothetical protein
MYMHASTFVFIFVYIHLYAQINIYTWLSLFLFYCHLGSARLMEVADNIEEIKTTCHFCNKKAVFSLKHVNGVADCTGPSVQLGEENSPSWLALTWYCVLVIYLVYDIMAGPSWLVLTWYCVLVMCLVCTTFVD